MFLGVLTFTSPSWSSNSPRESLPLRLILRDLLPAEALDRSFQLRHACPISCSQHLHGKLWYLVPLKIFRNQHRGTAGASALQQHCPRHMYRCLSFTRPHNDNHTYCIFGSTFLDPAVKVTMGSTPSPPYPFPYQIPREWHL